MTEKLTLTIKETAEQLGISRSLAYSLARCGELPGVLKLGGRYLVSRYQLERYLNGNDGVKASE